MKNIDWYINDVNTRLTNHFYTALNRSFYGLARVDVQDNRVVPMVKNANGTYKEVLFNDKLDVSAFWVKTGEREVIDAGTEQGVELIITVNLRKMTAGESEEDIVNKAKESIEITGFNIDDIAVDTDAINDFDYSRYIYPYFCFKFSGSITV